MTRRAAPAPFALADVPWHEPPGHHSSISQYLVGREEFGAGIEVRMSRCAPGGEVATHVHEVAEHVYVFLEGSGFVTNDHVEYPVSSQMVLFVPPATEHSVRAVGEADLVFLVVTSPSGALPR